MKTITLKANDNFLNILNNLAKELNKSKSDIIRTAIIKYNEFIEKEKLKKQFKIASQKVRDESKKIAKEFEITLNDGLKNV